MQTQLMYMYMYIVAVIIHVPAVVIIELVGKWAFGGTVSEGVV